MKYPQRNYYMTHVFSIFLFFKLSAELLLCVFFYWFIDWTYVCAKEHTTFFNQAAAFTMFSNIVMFSEVHVSVDPK